MSLKVSIGESGRHSVTLEKDRKKRSKERSSSKRSERDLREMISGGGREERGTVDLRDRLEQVRGQIAEHEKEAGEKDACETVTDLSSQNNLCLYSDEKGDKGEFKGKENSKDDTSEVVKGKEKCLTSEWGQRKKKKKKRSRSRSKERKPLADKDSENRKRKHSVEAESKDGFKSKKEKRRSVSREQEEKKKNKKEKRKEKKRSPSRSRDDVKRRSCSQDRTSSRSRDRKESSGRKSRIDSGISTLTDFSKDSVSPRDPLSPPGREDRSPRRSRTSPRRSGTSPRRGAGKLQALAEGALGLSFSLSLSPRKCSELSPRKEARSLRKESRSPRKESRSPRKESRSPKKEVRSSRKEERTEPSLSPSPSPPRRILVRAESVEKAVEVAKVEEKVVESTKEEGSKKGSDQEKGSPSEKNKKPKDKDVKSSKVKDRKRSRDKDRKRSRSQDKNEKRGSQDKKKILQEKEKKSSREKERKCSKEREVSGSQENTEQRSHEKEKKGSHEKERKSSQERERKSSQERERKSSQEKERKASQERDSKGSVEKERKGSQERKDSKEKEGRNPYSVYEEKQGRRGEREGRRRSRSRSRGRDKGDLKEEVERMRRDRMRRSRSRSRNRGRRVSDDMYRRGREGRYPRAGRREGRFSGDLLVRRSSDRQDSWEDKVESFLQSTTSSTLLVPLLPQDFDPSKPPPCMSSAPCPPDYALDYTEEPVRAYEAPAPAIRQLTDVTTGQIIPQSGLMPAVPAPGPPHPLHQYPTPDFTPSLPPPNYVQTEVTSFTRQPQPQQQQQDYPRHNEAMELAAMNQLNEENAKNRKEEEKPLTLKEKKKQEKAQKELWQFVAKMLIVDSVFCSKAKKKKSKSNEELREKAEKCAVRIAITLEKAGFSEMRLWKMLKDNEKGIQGFSAELSANVLNKTIEADVEARSPKHRLDAELLNDGAIFKYIGQYIQGNPANSGRKSATPPSDLPTNNELQSILAATQAPEMGPRREELHPFIKSDHESDWDFSNRSFAPLESWLVAHAHLTLAVSEAYCRTLVLAGFHYLRLKDTVTDFSPPEPENEGEPPETLYGHLLGCLREISFERYPVNITDGIDGHTSTMVKLVMEHFTPAASGASVSPAPASHPASAAAEPEAVPAGGNTGQQLARKKYVTMAVSVETLPVEGRLAVWQICLHTPGLPEEQDPDYECLMVPQGVAEARLGEAGFMYSQERAAWYHQGTEFGRRKAETEERSIEKLVNYLEELRGGGREAGLNNGLVLLFECTEDFGLVRSLLSSHSADIFSDTVRGVGCIDHFIRVSDMAASYCPPYFKYAVGEEGQWVTTLYRRGKALKIEAASRGEMVYNILEDVLDKCPTYDSFLRWYCYPSLGDTVALLARDTELIRQMLPLQTHVDRQLFNSRVQCVLEGVYAPRSELETRQPFACVARQAVRRLVSLGFNLDNLKNSFRADPNYEIPANVFLQDMTQVQRLRVHAQTDFVRKFIKEYFTPNYYNKF